MVSGLMVRGLMVRRLDSHGLDGEGLDSERLAHEVLDREGARSASGARGASWQARDCLQQATGVGSAWGGEHPGCRPDRKSTRLNSSHVAISYAVFCLKKKTKQLEHI